MLSQKINSTRRLCGYLFLPLALIRCADVLLTAEGYPGKPPGGEKITSGSTVSIGSGIYETSIDATSYSEWAYYDFETPDQIFVASPATNYSWDIAFQRFMVKLNGGASGNAGVNLVALNADNFSGRNQAPSPFNPAMSDVTDAGDTNDACRPTTSGVLFAFLNSLQSPNACWFSYSIGVLTPRDITYILKSTQARYYKIRIMSYYSSTGTSGKLKFQWGEVTPP
jgi:hypothetical protein